MGELSWDVDQGLIAQLKEQYRRERKGKKGVKSKSGGPFRQALRVQASVPPASIVKDVAAATTASRTTGGGGTRLVSLARLRMGLSCSSVLTGPNRSNLQDMLANLRDTEDIPPLQPPLNPPSRSPASKDHDLGRPDDGNLPANLPDTAEGRKTQSSSHISDP